MRTFADQCRHGKEELLLFPALGNKGVLLQGWPVGALTAERARGRNARWRLAAAYVCAVLRTIVSLAQPGVTEKKIPGSPDLPRFERTGGQ